MNLRMRFYFVCICIATLFHFNSLSQAQVLEQDSLALVALYDSTDGNNWTNNENWLTGPVSTWYGIKVLENRVDVITLRNNNLVGVIPIEIGNITNLTELHLRSNLLTGEIPTTIGNLTDLKELYLWGNNLTGELSLQLGDLINLTQLNISDNQFTGEIPIEIWNMTNLTLLYLNNNQLEGQVPSDIENLTNLVYLSLSSNQLTGEIPIEINNLDSLKGINLSWNQFEGEILPKLCNLKKLENINLYRNQFTGEIPSEIGNLSNLRYLDISENKFTGEIPAELWNLTNLIDLDLWENQLTGVIPPEIGNLTKLINFRINENQLNGKLPSEVSNLNNLKRLYLSHNNFEGTIPQEIINLSQLKYFYIQNNYFVDLPDLSSMPNLYGLLISNNKFTFEDIEPNIDISTFHYSPQDSVGAKLDTTISEGTSLTLFVEVGGTANIYQWTKDGTPITGATENTFTIDSADNSDSGLYICEITNTIATALTLYSREINVTVEGAVYVEKTENKLPTEYTLCQNYPNPFNPSTTIKYEIPGQARNENAQVTLKVYDILGREVATLVNEQQKPGYYKVEWDAKNHSSGVYFYKIRAGEFVMTKKMILMK